MASKPELNAKTIATRLHAMFGATLPPFARSMIAQAEFVDRLNPGVEMSRQMKERFYERTAKDFESLEISNLKPDKDWGPKVTQQDRKKAQVSLWQNLIIRFLIEKSAIYARRHGWKGHPSPHDPIATFYRAYQLAKSKQFDIGLSVEPEGSVYAYFFRLFGVPVKHVTVDYASNGSLIYHETESLAPLKGKKVLIIEDDVRTGRTLDLLVEKLKAYHPGELSVFLGNLEGFQKPKNVPRIVRGIHLGKLEHGEMKAAEEKSIRLFGRKLVKRRYLLH